MVVSSHEKLAVNHRRPSRSGDLREMIRPYAHLNVISLLICFRLNVFFFNLYMTVQFVASVVATFTIIFLLGVLCMRWQIFIEYRSVIRSAHNRVHKAPCHTVVARRPPKSFWVCSVFAWQIRR